MNRPRLLLNCDVGESLGAWRMGSDEQVMPLIDMANVACGFHASDPLTMTRTVGLAKQSGTRVGAHPSYPDLIGFGRRSMQCSAAEIASLMQYQLGALDGICRAQGLRISYVKPHGALYNDMMRDSDILKAVLAGVAGYGRDLPLMLLAKADNSDVQTLARGFGVDLILEAFADRAYDRRGYLVPRSQAGAVHRCVGRILEQSLQLAEEGTVTSQDGERIPIEAETLCVHGDNHESVQAVKSIRQAFDRLYGNLPA